MRYLINWLFGGDVRMAEMYDFLITLAIDNRRDIEELGTFLCPCCLNTRDLSFEVNRWRKCCREMLVLSR